MSNPAFPRLFQLLGVGLGLLLLLALATPSAAFVGAPRLAAAGRKQQPRGSAGSSSRRMGAAAIRAQAEGGDAAVSRGGLLANQGAGLALLGLSVLGGGVLPASAGTGSPQVTDKAYFDVAIGGQPVGRLTFALYGKEAPTITGNFLRVLDGKAQGASYQYSTIFRVEKDVCIDLGRVTGGGGKKIQKNINESGYMRISTANAADWTANTEVNDLRHDAPYLLTMKRGGGTYEFSITLNPSTALDRDHVVFGRLEMEDPQAKAENEEVVRRILAVPISKEDPIQSKKLFSSAGKGFDPRAKIQFLGKPLTKIQVRGTGRV